MAHTRNKISKIASKCYSAVDFIFYLILLQHRPTVKKAFPSPGSERGLLERKVSSFLYARKKKYKIHMVK